jgi:hypothetical protein
MHYVRPFFFLSVLSLDPRCRILKMFMMMVMCVLVVSGPPSTDATTIQRINYGTMFKKIGHIQLASEYWLHTYQIQLPTEMDIPPIPECHNPDYMTPTCTALRHLITHANVLRNQTLSTVNKTLRKLYEIVPQREIMKGTKRTQRAPLDFIGSIAESIFGIATVSDINMLAKHINALQDRNMHMATSLTRHAQHWSSFIKKVDHRFANIVDALKSNNQEITELITAAKQINESFSNMQNTYMAATEFVMDQVTLTTQITHELYEAKHGINALINGHLSPLCLPPATLAHTISGIQQLITKHYKNFHLIHTDTAYYYAHAQVLFTRQDLDMFITIKFPIHSNTVKLTAYECTSYPVPVANTTNHATQLLDVPDYIIISHDHQRHATLSQKQLDQCTKQNIIHCPFNIPLTSTTAATCISALFYDQKDTIHKTCDFRLVPYIAKTRLIELTPSSVLVYHSPRLAMECESDQKIIPGCTFCVIKIPCSCSLTAQDLYLPPRLTHCKHYTENITRVHFPVNIAILMNYFQPIDYSTITGSTMFNSPISINVPNMKLYNHNFSEFLANDRRDHLSLKRVATAAKADETIFKSLTEPLLEGKIAISNSWLNTNTIINIVSIGTATVCGITTVILGLKIRKLTIMMLLLQNSQPIRAIPSFSYNAFSTPTPESENVQECLNPHILPSIQLAITILAVTLIARHLLRHCIRSPTTTLYLEMTTGPTCIMIPISSLGLCRHYWHITPPTTIANIKVTHRFPPRFHVEMTGLKATNVITKQQVQIPQEITIGPITAFRVNRLITQRFQAFILVESHGLFEILMPPQTTTRLLPPFTLT